MFDLADHYLLRADILEKIAAMRGDDYFLGRAKAERDAANAMMTPVISMMMPFLCVPWYLATQMAMVRRRRSKCPLAQGMYEGWESALRDLTWPERN